MNARWQLSRRKGNDDPSNVLQPWVHRTIKPSRNTVAKRNVPGTSKDAPSQHWIIFSRQGKEGPEPHHHHHPETKHAALWYRGLDESKVTRAKHFAHLESVVPSATPLAATPRTRARSCSFCRQHNNAHGLSVYAGHIGTCVFASKEEHVSIRPTMRILAGKEDSSPKDMGPRTLAALETTEGKARVTNIPRKSEKTERISPPRSSV